MYSGGKKEYPFHVYTLILFTGTPVKNNSTNVVEYQMQGPLQYLVWYHAVGLIWINEFILAFQQMTIAGAVVTYYFTRYKKVTMYSVFYDMEVSLLPHFLHISVFFIYIFNSVFSLYVINLRDKSQLPATPILSAMARTIRYHLGTLAKGSFIITLVKIPRLILTYIHSQLKGKVI